MIRHVYVTPPCGNDNKANYWSLNSQNHYQSSINFRRLFITVWQLFSNCLLAIQIKTRSGGYEVCLSISLFYHVFCHHTLPARFSTTLKYWFYRWSCPNTGTIWTRSIIIHTAIIYNIDGFNVMYCIGCVAHAHHYRIRRHCYCV